MPKVDVNPLAELSQAYVLKMLKKGGLVDDTFIKRIMSWRHIPGFSVGNKVRIKPGDEKGIENSLPMSKKYTERVEVVPFDDGWPGFEEKVVEF